MVLSLLSSGSNARGQLATGALDDLHRFSPCHFFGCPPGELPSGTTRIVDLKCGANHTLVLLERMDYGGTGTIVSEVWGSGDGSAGQLGPLVGRDTEGSVLTFTKMNLSDMHSKGYSPILIAACWKTSYIVFSKKEKDCGDVVISMGADDFGNLGIGNQKIENGSPAHWNVIQFGHLSIRGIQMSEASTSVEAISSSQHHVVLRMHANTADRQGQRFMVGWGACRHGQLGDQRLPGHSEGLSIQSTPCVLTDAFIDSSSGMVSLSLGLQHSVFLNEDGRLHHLGSNRKGQIQGLKSIENIHLVGCTWNGTYAVTSDSSCGFKIYSTGSNTHGQLGRPISLDAVLDVVTFPSPLTGYIPESLACGSEHVIVLMRAMSDGGSQVWGWGWNEHGNLGIGTTDDVQTPVKIWSLPGTDSTGRHVVAIWAGVGTSWILVQDQG